MQFAINTPNFDWYSDPRLIAELAYEAEAAGWDGFFLWDHIGAAWPAPIGDPWIMLAAMAMRTTRIRLGPIVTPLPRRRPWKLAKEAVTLDHLSGGRLILGVGIGSDSGQEYSCYGEAADDRLHASMLDEGLEILAGLWSGEPFSFTGSHYQIHEARFQPVPVQQPRIPIWVAGIWPHHKPFRRAAAWDGVCPLAEGRALTPDDYRAITTYIRQQGSGDKPFAVLASGQTGGTDLVQDAALVGALAEAGATWWQESFDWNHSEAQVRARIRRGPPQI